MHELPEPLTPTKKRTAISKKTRFEVFKRDGFSCQYCGAHPPEAILEADHIQPVADGGPDHIDNLITSCFSCNRGKGARPLHAVPQSLSAKAQEVKEREEQIHGYYAALAQKRERIEREIDEIDLIFSKFHPGYTLADSARRSVKNFLEKLGLPAVIEAMEISGDRWGSHDKIFRYFCGVCWNKVRGD